MAFAVLFGGFCYVRNLVNTGNPVYPIQVRVFGRELFAGPRSPEVYSTHPFHAFGEFSISGMRRYLGPLWQAMAALCLAASLLAFRHAPWPRAVPRAATLALPFLFFGAMIAASPYRWIRFAYAGIMLLPLGPAVVGGMLERRLLSRTRLPSRARVGFARAGEWGGGMILLMGLVGVLIGAAALPRTIRKYQLEKADWYERVCQRQFGVQFAEGWRALDELTVESGARVGYWSMDVSYPLFGRRLQNTVFFVPRNHWTFASFYRSGSTVRDVSGEGNDIVIGGLKDGDRPSFEAWTRNLAKLEVDYLFIGPDLSRERWPLEDTWAKILADAGRMERVAQGKSYVIYRVTRSASSAQGRAGRVREVRRRPAQRKR